MQTHTVIDVTTRENVVYNYSVENPTTSLTSQSLGIVDSASGEQVSAERSLDISAVWQAITLIAGDISKLRIELFERDDDDSPRRLRSNPYELLVRKRMNPVMTAFKAWNRILVQFLLYSNGYAWIQRDRVGMPVAIWPMMSPLTYVEYMDGRPYYTTTLHDKTYSFHHDDVLHFERMCIDDECGEDLVSHARELFGLALARQRFAAQYFNAGGRVGGQLILPATFDERAQREAIEGFKAMYQQTGSAFLTYFAKAGIEYRPGEFAPADAQVVEGARESNRDVARYFNLHPSKLGEEHQSAYASKAEDNRDYLDTTLSPHLEQITQELEFKLFTPAEFEADQLYFEYNTDRLLAMSGLDRANQLLTLRQGEIISSNEARKRENLPPRPGGDDYANPNTRSPGSETEETDDEELNAAFAELLASQISVTLKAATQKIHRQVDKSTFAHKRGALISEAVDRIAGATDKVLAAYAAAKGLEDAPTLRPALNRVLADAMEDFETYRSRLDSGVLVPEFVSEVIPNA